jgi:AcrR family transcriptional regulator
MPYAQRRQQLVDAAITVMTREGVQKATTRAIVAEADTSLSVFHYCFESKQQLLDAVIKSLVGTSVDLAEASFRPGASRREMIRAGLDAYWTHVTAHPQEHLLTYELTQYCLRTTGYEEVAREQYDHYANAFTAILGTIGEGERLDVVGRYCAALIDGLTLDWLVRRDDESARLVLDRLASELDDILVADHATA